MRIPRTLTAIFNGEGCRCGNPDWPGTCPGWRSCPLQQPEPPEPVTRLIWQCPYCESDLADEQASCCGESGHAVHTVIEEDPKPDAPWEPEPEYEHEDWLEDQT